MTRMTQNVSDSALYTVCISLILKGLMEAVEIMPKVDDIFLEETIKAWVEKEEKKNDDQG